MGGKLFIPDRNFCVGVDDGSLPVCGEGQDLTAGDAKPPGEQCGSRMEMEHVGESGFGPWEAPLDQMPRWAGMGKCWWARRARMSLLV